MRFSLGLAGLGAIATAALVYGVVLNGFGLFDAPAPTTAQTPAAPASPAPANSMPASGAPSAEPGAATQPQPEPPQAPVRAARNVTPPNVLSRPTSRYREPQPEPEPIAEEEEATRRFHRVVVRDAATLEVGDRTIRFAGVSPIAADKTCTDEAGQTWPCGRVAAAALRLLIRHRAVDCTVVSESDGTIAGACSVGPQDINAWLVEQGWASVLEGEDYAEEADAAKAEKRGIYLAKWEAKGGGGTGDVPQSAFTAPQIPSDPYSDPPPEAPVEGAAN